jgi:hypothetical protein
MDGVRGLWSQLSSGLDLRLSASEEPRSPRRSFSWVPDLPGSREIAALARAKTSPLDLDPRAPHTSGVEGPTWQWVVVLAIELGALAYLGRQLFGRASPPKRRGPDVPVQSLLRKKR